MSEKRKKIDKKQEPKSLMDLDAGSTAWVIALASLSAIIEEKGNEQNNEQTASEY